MCEKCANPEIKHHPEHEGVKPFQKKLNSNALKGKISVKKATSKP